MHLLKAEASKLSCWSCSFLRTYCSRSSAHIWLKKTSASGTIQDFAVFQKDRRWLDFFLKLPCFPSLVFLLLREYLCWKDVWLLGPVTAWSPAYPLRPEVKGKLSSPTSCHAEPVPPGLVCRPHSTEALKPPQAFRAAAACCTPMRLMETCTKEVFLLLSVPVAGHNSLSKGSDKTQCSFWLGALFLWTRSGKRVGLTQTTTKSLGRGSIFLYRRKLMWCALVNEDLSQGQKSCFLSVSLALKTHPNILPLKLFFLSSWLHIDKVVWRGRMLDGH